MSLPRVTRLPDHGPFRRYDFIEAFRSCVMMFDNRGGGPHVEVAHFIADRASPLSWPELFESGRYRGDVWHTPTPACRALLEAADAEFLGTTGVVAR